MGRGLGNGDETPSQRRGRQGLEHTNPELAALVVKMYVEDALPYTEVATRLGLTSSRVYKLLKRLGIPRRSVFDRGSLERYERTDFLSDEQRHTIEHQYVDLRQSAKATALVAGVSESTVKRYLDRKGLGRNMSQAKRIYHLREDAFDEITEGSAYWLGFLITDGGVTSHREFAVGLQGRDYAHLEKLNVFLGDPRRKIGRSHDGKKCWVTYSSEHMVERLAHWGVTRQKSFTAKAHSDLVASPDFWRGAIDGDGSITKSGIALHTASPYFRDQFYEFLDEHGWSHRDRTRNDGRLFSTFLRVQGSIEFARLVYPTTARWYLDYKMGQAKAFRDRP